MFRIWIVTDGTVAGRASMTAGTIKAMATSTASSDSNRSVRGTRRAGILTMGLPP